MIEFFDVKEYLDDRDIHYKEEGKNVTEGWIEIKCMFCPDGDPSEHLGISPDMRYNCWRCGEKGTVVRLVQWIEDGCSVAEANTIIGQYQTIERQNRKRVETSAFSLPKEAADLQNIHQSYLIFRNFDPSFLVKKYQLKACHTFGKWKYRIIIPIIMKGRIVNFVGQDVTGEAKDPYRFCSNKIAEIDGNSCIYNIDNVKDIAIIVEGIVDVWRGGDEFVALFGMGWTNDQINLLIERNIKEIYIMFDGEELAILKAYKLAEELSSLKVFEKVEVVELEAGKDPADFSNEEMEEFRGLIFKEG